jgi:endonuclease/exonuclease/phosphatase (EEP) superfamily protein YafD
VILKRKCRPCGLSWSEGGLRDMRGLLCRLKRWWQAMASPQLPEMDSMRKEIRQAVHKNRNLTFNVSAESRKAQKVSRAATQSAHDAIARLEEARRKGGKDGPEVPLI